MLLPIKKIQLRFTTNIDKSPGLSNNESEPLESATRTTQNRRFDSNKVKEMMGMRRAVQQLRLTKFAFVVTSAPYSGSSKSHNYKLVEVGLMERPKLKDYATGQVNEKKTCRIFFMLGREGLQKRDIFHLFIWRLEMERGCLKKFLLIFFSKCGSVFGKSLRHSVHGSNGLEWMVQIVTDKML